MSVANERPAALTGNRARNPNATAYSGVINPLPLILLILAVDLFTPVLISRRVVPASARWISQATIAAILFWAYVRMIVWDRIPRAVWLVGFGSAIWITVAILHGQGIEATVWGWWVMFQYPLLGLFAYLQPIWPESYPRRLRDLSVIILGLQVVIQILQYLNGKPVGDFLAGFFGAYGTGKLVISILFVLCLALGHWLAHGKWTTLAWVLALGSISSALGEMKFFPFAVALLCGLAIIIRQAQRRRLWMVVRYGILLVAILSVFFLLYNLVVPSAANVPLEQFFTNPQALTKYLDQKTTVAMEGDAVFVDIGRNYAIGYAWDSIRSDPATFLLGLGLGARGESRRLGIAGAGFQQGGMGFNSGTSLLVFMQELGLLGMVTVIGFFVWIILSLRRGIRDHPQSVALETRYALLLFSLPWPLWFWYNTVWTLRVAMWLYWTTLGYVMSEARGHGEQGGAREGNTGFAGVRQ